ncbi:FAD-dependent oxidoreductase [Actinacidiphila paucisporea]|uniref:FAD-dependent oxidoreductase n=1 Tax=Actinacidiphila paucisporea TaxID=310782 RepID=UPI0009A0B9A2|nr:FAD-dependent oxidoreductase [Actinacidiphila paucisporea]
MTSTQPEQRLTTDVLVIGGGPAGTWAAIKAAQAGADVVLADKGHTGASGATASVGTGILVGGSGRAAATARVAVHVRARAATTPSSSAPTATRTSSSTGHSVIPAGGRGCLRRYRGATADSPSRWPARDRGTDQASSSS